MRFVIYSLTTSLLFFGIYFLPVFSSANDKRVEGVSLIEQISDLHREIGELKKHTVPKNAVVAFNQEKCPDDTWMPYEKAYGKFIRGIDLDGSTDTGGKRKHGGIQDDAFQGHGVDFGDRWSLNYLPNLRWSTTLLDMGQDNGFMRLQIAGIGSAGSSLGGTNHLATQSVVQLKGTLTNTNSFGNLRMDSETRPKNVALLYCIKK